MYLPKTITPQVGLVCLIAAGVPSCGSSDAAGARETSLERAAWLGSAEGWGLLGFATAGGPLAYRRGEDLETPTWAPPKLDKVQRGWPGPGSIWLQLDGPRIGRYDYASGYLTSFRSAGPADAAVVLEGDGSLVVAVEGQTLQLVAPQSRWRYRLAGRLRRLESAGQGRLLAVVETGEGAELLVLAPTDSVPLGRRTLSGLSDLAVLPWGSRLIYLLEGEDPPVLHELGLPQLEELRAIELVESASLVAVTPSGHRSYLVSGQNLYVYDNLSGKRLRRVEVPGPATALRFGVNGAVLLARLDNADSVIVVQVGIDRPLGVIAADWNDHLPAVLPGGRLTAQADSELVLYSIPGLDEIARGTLDTSRVWFPVSWEPPRPRTELVQRTAGAGQDADRRAAERQGPGSPGAGAAAVSAAPPGYYAVVIAARDRKGVDDLVEWLRSVEFPATVDRHVDVMGVVWFRAMAGPYERRETAEEAARTLGTRYGYKPWILSVDDPGA